MIIGAQLYNLREHCKTLEDLEKTLYRVAEMGYKIVQLSGVCDYTAEEMILLLEKTGLKAPLTHFSYKRIVEDTDATIKLHKDIGIEYVGLGSMPGFKKGGCTKEIIDAFADEVAPAVKKIKESGLKFMYHNHNMEFVKYEEGITALEYLVNKFSPDEFGVTLDGYWVVAGGADPVEWLYRLNGRCNCIHLKDMVYSAEDGAVRMCPIGKGNINYKRICEEAIHLGVEYAFIEQDHSYGEDPFECLKQSFDYLHSIGLC